MNLREISDVFPGLTYVILPLHFGHHEGFYFYYVVSLKAVMPIKAPYFYKCDISQFIDMAHKGHD